MSKLLVGVIAKKLLCTGIDLVIAQQTKKMANGLIYKI
jgi:hypothetical protein